MYDIHNIIIDDTYIVRDSSTSDGSQIKYRRENKWYKIDNLGGEAEAEALSSLLLEHSKLSSNQYVHYDRILINGTLGCVSDDFLVDYDNGEFITFYRLYKNIYGRDLASVTSRMDYDDAINYVIDFVKEVTGLNTTTYLANIFYLDEIILNNDRHFNNYGIIMQEDVYKIAPIFDNGKSLLVGQKYDSKSQKISDVKKNIYSKSFSPSFNLNSSYLAKYRTLSIDKTGVLESLNNCPPSIQKDVLTYQVKSII